MIKKYIKSEVIISLLESGWEIYTSRCSGPGNGLRFFICKEGEPSKAIHHQTMAKLLRDQILLGYEHGHDKYRLRAS